MSDTVVMEPDLNPTAIEIFIPCMRSIVYNLIYTDEMNLVYKYYLLTYKAFRADEYFHSKYSMFSLD